MTISSNAPSAPSSAMWQPQDQEAIRQCLALPATVPCLDAIDRAMADLLRQHPAGVLSARALLDAVALIDQQLLAGGCEQEQAIQKRSHSGPIAGSVAADGDAPLQKADVIAYDTALLREESETTYANPSSPGMGLLRQRRRYADQLLLLLPALSSWVQFTAQAAGQLGTTPMLRGWAMSTSPRRFTSGRHPRAAGTWPATPLQPFANARLLLAENAIPGDTTSAVVAAHVLECFLSRQRYISAKENGPGVDTGDFTYSGMICRATRLPPHPGAIWLSSTLSWQQNGRRVASGGSTVVAPCEGLIWLGDLRLLNPAGAADVDPYAQHTAFVVLEFGADYGSGGIGALVQPLIGERVFGTLKPNRQ